MPDLLIDKLLNKAREHLKKRKPNLPRKRVMDTLAFESRVLDMADFAREREKEIAAELYGTVLVFNNDPRHEDIPDPCVMCAALDAVEEIWKRLGAGKR